MLGDDLFVRKRKWLGAKFECESFGEGRRSLIIGSAGYLGNITFLLVQGINMAFGLGVNLLRNEVGV